MLEPEPQCHLRWLLGTEDTGSRSSGGCPSRKGRPSSKKACGPELGQMVGAQTHSENLEKPLALMSPERSFIMWLSTMSLALM